MLNYPENTVILLVDDNPTNLSVLSHSLKAAGLRTRFAVDGESAIEQATEDAPDLILLDLQMPGMDGFETCTHLKANPLTRDIPIIFITASSNTENKVKGLSLGAVDYVTKPFQQDEVLARVRVHLTLRYLTRKVQEQAIALQNMNAELHRLANLDGLTEVANRRRFDQYLEEEWQRSAREQHYLSLVLCDIDYFKLYNDFYGHQAGDACLRSVAKAIEESLKRPSDLVARYGGEEFAVILPNTPPHGAVAIVERIQERIMALQIPHAKSGISTYITLSLGVTTQIPSLELPASSLITFADKALYSAKRKGRNGFHQEWNASNHHLFNYQLATDTQDSCQYPYSTKSEAIEKSICSS
jgi:diguanylate cyclase (GGDEF)-like protein